jgi:hypothetical protein
VTRDAGWGQLTRLRRVFGPICCTALLIDALTAWSVD